MLGLKGFRRKPREFDYRPRYYDMEKERREERRREILGGEADEATHTEEGEYIPGQYIRERRMRKGRMFDSRRKTQRKPQTLRLAVIIAFIFFLLWYIFVR